MARRKEIEPLVYEKKKDETAKQFEAFKVYRDMGLTRNLREVAEKLNKSLALIGRWSSLNNWVERVAEYDADMDRKELLENVKKRKEMVRRHANTSIMFQQKILERIRSMRPDELSTGDLAKWLEVAVKIERLSLGESTEINDNTNTVNGNVQTTHLQRMDLSNMTDEELDERLKTLMEQAEEE